MSTRTSMTLWVAVAAACSPAGSEEPDASRVDTRQERGPELALVPTPAAPSLAAIPSAEAEEILDDEHAKRDAQYWGEERLSNRLSAGPLRDLRSILLGPWGPASRAPGLADVFTEEARIAPLEPLAFEEEEVTKGVVRRIWIRRQGTSALESVEPGRHTSPSAWKEALDRIHGSMNRVRWALVKPTRVERTGYGARVELSLSLNRELPSGAIQHDEGEWLSEWVEVGADDDKQWRCRLIEPLRNCRSLVSSSPHFVDATGEAFAGTALDPRIPIGPRGGVQRGVALADLDEDGDLDVVVTVTNRVLYNRGDGTFVDRSREVLLGGHGVADGRGFGGVLAADFDRDGNQDLLMAGRMRRATLYLQRDGRFHPRPIDSSFDDVIPASLAAHDVDGDGWLDVFIPAYGVISDPGPDDITGATNGMPNQMLRGLPDGAFEDVTAEWGFGQEGTRWTFVAAFADPDDDGDFDLYAANDFGPNVFYRRRGGTAVRFTAEVEDPESIEAGFSMSATWADLDDDLDLDLYVSNMSSNAADRIRRSSGDPTEDRLVRSGIGMDEIRRRMSKGNTMALNEGGRLVEAQDARGAKNARWAWGTAIFDYDCDRDLDIHCLNGFFTHGSDDGRDL